jgi:hypothetical protein
VADRQRDAAPVHGPVAPLSGSGPYTPSSLPCRLRHGVPSRIRHRAGGISRARRPRSSG